MKADPVFDAFSAALRASPADPLTALADLPGVSEEVRLRAGALLRVHLQGPVALGVPFVVDECDLDAPARIEAGQQIGPYRVVRELDRGGMATVYVAERVAPYRETVALKVPHTRILSPDLRDRFHRERQTLADLRHPWIVSLLGGGELEDGTPYAVMEFVDGRPIDVYCRQEDLDVRGTLAVFQRVCEAVGHAHARGIIHRDLKPSNILIQADGTPKLLDFGIAKLLDPDGRDAADTALSVRLMTPDYASPEQRAGARPLTPASDVYSLGLILRQLVDREGQDPAPGAVRTLLATMLADVPAERQQHVDEVVAGIRAVLAGEGPAASPTTRRQSGHEPFVASVTLAHAALYAVAVTGEVAYRWSDHSRIILLPAAGALAGGGIAAFAASAVLLRRRAIDERAVFPAALAVYVAIALATWALVRPFMPADPVVSASFQTFTAQTGVLKGIVQAMLLFVPCVLVPFHLVLSLERLAPERQWRVLRPLLAKEAAAAPPRGAVYVPVSALTIYFAAVALWLIGGVVFLLNNLKPSTDLNIYIALLLLRTTLLLGVGGAGILYYQLQLDGIRRRAAGR